MLEATFHIHLFGLTEAEGRRALRNKDRVRCTVCGSRDVVRAVLFRDCALDGPGKFGMGGLLACPKHESRAVELLAEFEGAPN